MNIFTNNTAGPIDLATLGNDIRVETDGSVINLDDPHLGEDFDKGGDLESLPQVTTAVDGTIVDWNKLKQVHPLTGQEFDFDGKLLFKEGE